MGSKTRFGCLAALLAVALLGIGVVGGAWLAQRHLGAKASVPPARVAREAPALAVVTPLFLPTPSHPPPATPLPTLWTLTPAAVTPLAAPAGNTAAQAVLFRVQAAEVRFREGPGSAYPPIASAVHGALLPMVGRTPNGLWWQACCLDGQPVWMALDGSTVLESGDVATVPIVEAVIRDLAPVRPSVPPAVAEAPREAPPTQEAPPTVTPLPAGNPACAIAGASYQTIPVVGAPRTIPAARDPEINLALRGYAPVDGFLQLVGIGGETDVHAPQFSTFFADLRIDKDYPGVYRVHHWNWNCNCRGEPITQPEVTMLAVSTRPGELLYVPDRTGGDIGGGYRVMVLFATPSSLTLKYTREDNMLAGYGLHIEGICVDPALLDLYYQMDQAGRQQLPVLRGRQAIGYAIGGDIKIAIRDTGQFMDPRSQKDWWVPQ